MSDSGTFMAGLVVGIILVIVIVTCWQGFAWKNATEVLMDVHVGGYNADGQPQETVHCMGRIRYDRMGEIHVIGGIGPLTTPEGG